MIIINLTSNRFWRRASVNSVVKQKLIRSPFSSTSKLDNDEFQTTQRSPLLTNSDELRAIVNSFPIGIDYAFGYGSGVLKQQSSGLKDSDSKPAMVDIILAVNDPYSWHQRNLQCHPQHYSGFARKGGPRFVNWMQKLGARLYFHPFVNVEASIENDVNDATKHQTIQREIKYGVVSTDDLIEDLMCWKYLYLAGRMHKPTVEIDLKTLMKNETNLLQIDRKAEIADAQHQNLLAAVSASILLHGGGEQEDSLLITHLYNTIAGISYAGDIRMQTGAEDPNKVKKLVESPGVLRLWEDMYSTIFRDLQSLGILTKTQTKVEIDLNDIAMRKQLIHNLPQRLNSDRFVGVSSSKLSILHGSELLRTELANIVAPAAKIQSIKGLFSAGISKSFKYATAKLAKGRLTK
jgi:translocator assembly and maintenance protein 41